MKFEHLETDGAVKAAAQLATEEWGLMEAISPVAQMQQTLTAAYGAGALGAPIDESLALCIIAKMGETFEAESGEGATVALGELLVGVSRLAANHELSVGPVFDLGRILTRRSDVIPLNAQARLARAVYEGDRCDVSDEMKRARLVGALAMCVAKGLEDVEMLHDVVVKPPELLVVYGREVLARLAAETVT